jgi:HEAT repeat protein
MAAQGGVAAMKALVTVLEDPGETVEVKRNVLDGLGQGTSAASMDIVARALAHSREPAPHAAKVLASRKSKADIKHLAGIFRDADTAFREKLIPVFREIGRESEGEIIALLHEESGPLRPFLSRILEETGCVESAIRRLSHRKTGIRREAAAFLSLLDTPAAYRGLLLAAKDPDRELRTLVAAALEKTDNREETGACSLFSVL